MNRKEHLEWCKKRARDYVEKGEYQNAITSMISDLGKHPETAKSLEIANILLLTINLSYKDSVLRFIGGFS